MVARSRAGDQLDVELASRGERGLVGSVVDHHHIDPARPAGRDDRPAGDAEAHHHQAEARIGVAAHQATTRSRL